jgi:hypothetical protein
MIHQKVVGFGVSVKYEMFGTGSGNVCVPLPVNG